MSPTTDCLVMAKPAGPALQPALRLLLLPAQGSPVFAGTLAHAGRPPRRFIIQRLQPPRARSRTSSGTAGSQRSWAWTSSARFVRLQKEDRPRGPTITNGIQTNGMLLDEAWAGFLGQEGFSVGLSIDGPADLHDAFRVTAEGRRHARSCGWDVPPAQAEPRVLQRPLRPSRGERGGAGRASTTSFAGWA